jgi:Pirin C-terminal cupin domain
LRVVDDRLGNGHGAAKLGAAPNAAACCSSPRGRGGAAADARIVLIGGAPIDGERHIWWNFVSSSNARIEQAKRDWKGGLVSESAGGRDRIDTTSRMRQKRDRRDNASY